MTSDNQQLTPTDRQLLARKVAADSVAAYRYFQAERQAFFAGWDAAMEYVEQERRLQAEAQIIQDAMDGRIK